MVMKRVKISDLKAHLSQYLREVEGGETIVVCDRDRPVAKLSAPDIAASGLKIRPPIGPMVRLENLPRARLTSPVDVVALLSEDRDSR